ETGSPEALARIVSSVHPDWLPASGLTLKTDIEFEVVRQRVIAFRRTYFHDLIVEQSPTSIPPEIDAGAMLAGEAAAHLELSALLSDDAQQFLTRVQCLSAWMPELELPSFNPDFIKKLLPEICAGLTSFEQIKTAPILSILQSKLSAKQLA